MKFKIQHLKNVMKIRSDLRLRCGKMKFASCRFASFFLGTMILRNVIKLDFLKEIQDALPLALCFVHNSSLTR